MFLRFWTLVAATCFSFWSMGQNHIIKGHVIDLQSGQPVINATIQDVRNQYQTISDGNGFFQLNINEDAGELAISSVGYKTITVKYRAGTTLTVQLESDAKSLTEVRITAFNSNRAIRETAGGIALVSGEQLRQGDGTSMQQAFNSVPGIRLDHSHGEDSRISIRGEGIRAPWGNRNVKIYLNDIPLTETDGTSRIEALDVSDLGQAEIIKGPASSLYGGGVGGVIRFRLERAPYREESIETSAMAGAYGLNRQALTYRSGGEKMNSFVSVGRQHTSGYRKHSRDDRKFMVGNFQWFPSENRIITFLFNRTIQDAQIPAPLTANQVKEDPTQVTAEYQDKKPGRIHKWTRIGIGQKYLFNNYLSNSSSIFTYFYDLEHPLSFGIINSTYQSFGGRTVFELNPQFAVVNTKFIAGSEFTQAHNAGTIYQNEHGEPGNIFSNTDYDNRSYSVFYQSETSIAQATHLVFGISINGLTYQGTDFLYPDRSGVKEFHAQLAPRIALSHNFNEQLSLHGSISSGFSNPSSDQIQNPDRSINKTIQAERGVNYEINAKGSLLDTRFHYDLAIFRMDMKGELIGQSLPFGITVYHNTGKTRHDGLELALSYQVIKEEDDHAISMLLPRIGVTWSHFTFLDYKVLGEDNNIIERFDGNKLTGIAPLMVSGGVNVSAKNGIYLNANIFYNDRYPLNDANTDFNPAYTVMNAKIGYRKKFSDRVSTNMYAGLQNITDARYSSFTRINASNGGAAPAYFNPALPRNAYAGVEIRYHFINK